MRRKCKVFILKLRNFFIGMQGEVQMKRLGSNGEIKWKYTIVAQGVNDKNIYNLFFYNYYSDLSVVRNTESCQRKSKLINKNMHVEIIGV